MGRRGGRRDVGQNRRRCRQRCHGEEAGCRRGAGAAQHVARTVEQRDVLARQPVGLVDHQRHLDRRDVEQAHARAGHLRQRGGLGRLAAALGPHLRADGAAPARDAAPDQLDHLPGQLRAGAQHDAQLGEARHDARGQYLIGEERRVERIVEAGGEEDLGQGRIAQIHRPGEVVDAGVVAVGAIVDVAFGGLHHQLAAGDLRCRHVKGEGLVTERAVEVPRRDRLAGRALEIQLEDRRADRGLHIAVAGRDGHGGAGIGQRGGARRVRQGHGQRLGALFGLVVDDRQGQGLAGLARREGDRACRQRSHIARIGRAVEAQRHVDGRRLGQVARPQDGDFGQIALNHGHVADRQGRRRRRVDRVVDHDGRIGRLADTRVIHQNLDRAVGDGHRLADETGLVGARTALGRGEGVVIVAENDAVHGEVADPRRRLGGREQFREMQLDDIAAVGEPGEGRGPAARRAVAVRVIGRSVQIDPARVRPGGAGLAVHVGELVGLGRGVERVAVGLEGHEIAEGVGDDRVGQRAAIAVVVDHVPVQRVGAQRAGRLAGGADVDRADHDAALQIVQIRLEHEASAGRLGRIAGRVVVGPRGDGHFAHAVRPGIVGPRQRIGQRRGLAAIAQDHHRRRHGVGHDAREAEIAAGQAGEIRRVEAGLVGQGHDDLTRAVLHAGRVGHFDRDDLGRDGIRRRHEGSADLPDHQPAQLGLVDRGVEFDVQHAVGDGGLIGLDQFLGRAAGLGEDVESGLDRVILDEDVEEPRAGAVGAAGDAVEDLGEIEIDQIIAVLDRDGVAPFSGIDRRAFGLVDQVEIGIGDVGARDRGVGVGFGDHARQELRGASAGGVGQEVHALVPHRRAEQIRAAGADRDDRRQGRFERDPHAVRVLRDVDRRAAIGGVVIGQIRPAERDGRAAQGDRRRSRRAAEDRRAEIGERRAFDEHRVIGREIGDHVAVQIGERAAHGIRARAGRDGVGPRPDPDQVVEIVGGQNEIRGRAGAVEILDVRGQRRKRGVRSGVDHGVGVGRAGQTDLCRRVGEDLVAEGFDFQVVEIDGFKGVARRCFGQKADRRARSLLGRAGPDGVISGQHVAQDARGQNETAQVQRGEIRLALQAVLGADGEAVLHVDGQTQIDRVDGHV